MPRLHLDHPWRTLWGIATSNYVLAGLLLIVALSLLVAAWLPQTSHEGLNDVEWQAQVERRLGQANWFDALRAPLQTVGAFQVADAIGFRVVLALVTLCLLVRLAETLDRLRQRWQLRADGRALAEGVASPGADGADGAATESENPNASRSGLDRGPWKELGGTGVYLGALVILLGAAISHQNGWRVGPLAVTAGQSIPLGDNSGLTLHVTSLEPDGRGGAGEIWRGEETLVGAGDLGMGEPLAGAGVGAFVVGSGTGWRVRATRGDQILELATGPGTAAMTELDLIFSAEEPGQLVGVPEADLVLLLTIPEVGPADAPLHAQVFEEGSGTYIDEREIARETTFTVREVTFSLAPIPFAEIKAMHDRGAFWIQLGILVTILGLAIVGLGFILARRVSPRGPSGPEAESPSQG